jgi:hypothetical protein
MERSKFIESAPNYYALAIAAYFNSGHDSASEIMVRSFYELPGQLRRFSGDDDPETYLDNEVLFRRATKILMERGFLTEIIDDFGPTIFEKTEGFDEAWSRAEQDNNLPFRRYQLVDRGKNWLQSALATINAQYAELKITESDLESPYDEWEPLPLDRKDPNLQAVTSQLDETISQIQADNGYAATLPGERDIVVDLLSSAAHRLKMDPTISWGYLRRNAFEPLKTVLRRFKGAALGAAVTTMITIFHTWIQSLGVEWLDVLWRAFWSSM